MAIDASPRGPGSGGDWRVATVAELQRESVLLVEDGNHGESRPRPDEFIDQGVAFIRAADMGAGRVLFDTAAKINHRAVERITKGIGKPGDVLLSHKGTVGKVAFVPDDAPPFVCSPQTTFWRSMDESRIDRRYLHAFLRSPDFHAQLATRAGETDMAPYVSLTSQRGLSVTLPPLWMQRGIAQILAALDDKIDLNRRMSETLEATARALFKSWFVDFDPVRAKGEGRDPGLPQALAGRFPAAWESSALGPIPAGWRVVPLRESTSYFSRGIGPAYVESGGICVVNQKCIRDGRVDFAQTKRHDPAKRSIEGRQLQFLDVLVNSTGIGTLGRVAQLWRMPEDAIADSHVTVLRPAHDVDAHYFGCVLRTRETEIEALGEGSTGQTELSRERLGSMPVLKPTSAVQEAFGGATEPLFAQVAAKERESATLAALRDALLPKLISGELRIPDAERIVGEVA